MWESRRKLRFESLLYQKQLNYRFSSYGFLREFPIQCTQCVVIVIVVVAAADEWKFLHKSSIEARGEKKYELKSGLWTLVLFLRLRLFESLRQLFFLARKLRDNLETGGRISSTYFIMTNVRGGEREGENDCGNEFQFLLKIFLLFDENFAFLIAPPKSFSVFYVLGDIAVWFISRKTFPSQGSLLRGRSLVLFRQYFRCQYKRALGTLR